LLPLVLASCRHVEHGTVDPDSMAKKLFDAVRNEDPDRTLSLLPDKGTYRKIAEANDMAPEDVTKAYEQFIQQATQNLHNTTVKAEDWSQSSFTRANYTESKLGKLPVATVTTKFLLNKEPNKLQFTAVKFNNRWYYNGDVTFVDKVE